MQGSTIGVRCVRTNVYFYWRTHDFGHGVVQKVRSLRVGEGGEGRGEGQAKANKNKHGEGGGMWHVCTFFDMKFYSHSPVFPIDYNGNMNYHHERLQNSVLSMNGCVHFRRPFLLCTTFPSFLCTVYYFLCAFSAKMATY